MLKSKLKILFCSKFFWLFLIYGLLLFFYPILFINKDIVFSDGPDGGDVRFVNYILEHGYLWLKRVEVHKEFWDLPFFYPAKNTLAFSDILLGCMFIYVPVRFFINDPLTALQIFTFISCILNYVSAYFLLKRIHYNIAPEINKTKLSLACTTGAFMFAFSLIRYYKFVHLQFCSQFYMLFSLLCFFCVSKNNSKLKNLLLFVFGGLLFSIQTYTAFYLGYFMVFGSLLAFFLLLIFKNTRIKMFAFFKHYFVPILISVIITLFSLIPLLKHYLLVGSQFSLCFDALFEPIYFLFSTSFLDYHINHFFRHFGHEFNNGAGILTSIFILFGIYKDKNNRIFLTLFLLFSFLFFSNEYLYGFLYKYFPGTSAIRCQSRIILLMLVFYIYSISFLIIKLKNKLLIALITILICIEQIPCNFLFDMFSFTKQNHYQRLEKLIIPEKCEVL